MLFCCPICLKRVSDSCPSIQCDKCNLWVHQANCSKLSPSQFEAFYSPNSSPWYCPKCLISSLPFYLDDISSPADVPTPSDVSPSSNISAEFKSLFSILNTVVDDSVVINDDNPEACLKSITCRYLECQDFNALSQNTISNFSAFHLNIASLSKHFD